MLSTSSLGHQDRNTDPEDQEQSANRKQTAQEDGEVAELRMSYGNICLLKPILLGTWSECSE